MANIRKISFGRSTRTTLEEISISLKTLQIRKTTKLVAQAETNLTAISTSQIPMLAKEVARKVPKSEREGTLNRRNPKKVKKDLLFPKVVEEERKRWLSIRCLNKNQIYY